VTIQAGSSFWRRPGTRLGWWAVGLGATFVALFIINSAVFMPVFSTTQNEQLSWVSRTLLPFYGIFMALCGLASGVAGLVAVLRKHERSWLVWLTLLPGAFMLLFILGELLVPH
jgi:cadmium resistance protein CadD (predicted permease)